MLDLAKKISYKWDPSLSDESDPGVVLLKLAALMADKCNYNIDKNILELFPASVTQLSNARQLFDQCGYTMRYYNSATTELTFKMIAEPELTDSDITTLLPDYENLDANTVNSDKTGSYLRHYTVPKFTMFSDVDNSVVYTITEELDIKSDGNPTSVFAVQGAINEYSINGSTTITADMLDSNRRLYFTEINIPENGIFISNVDEGEYWEAADNLLILPQGTKCYKFGLTLDGRKCYIEFPSDIDTIIGKGINIYYVLTSGTEGNVGRHVIRRFFSEPSIERHIANSSHSQSVELTTDNVYIINQQSAQNGRNPETIEEAYRNYQKVKTTFNTLVSTRDYTNFLRTNHDVSNCVVCDRSDDNQSTYRILNNVGGVNQLIPYVKSKTVLRSGECILDNGETVPGSFSTVEDEMTAFDLRVYGLKYVDGFNEDLERFSSSFDVVNFRREPNSIESSTADIKCLSHNYLGFESDRIILLKNRYPIVAKIVSPYNLSLSQQDEIIDRVKLNLFALLNSQMIEFGQEIDYNLVYDTILKSDPRISALILNELKYETYAVYLSSLTGKLELIRIDSQSSEPTADDEHQAEFLVNLWNKFRTEVYARSVLEGKTPLFVPENTFIYSLAQEQVQNGENTYEIKELSSSVSIPLTYYEQDGRNELVSRVLKPNDVITLTSPNLVMQKRYSNYCQFVTNIGCTLPDTDECKHPDYGSDEAKEIVVNAKEDYVLRPNEYIIFFWRTTDSETEPYSYVKYTGRDSSKPTIITPSFNIAKQPNTQMLNDVKYSIDDNMFMTLGDYGNVTVEGKQLTISSSLYYDKSCATASSESVTVPDISLNELIHRYFIGDKFSVTSNQIETKVVNKIHLNNDIDGTSKFYWVLNNTCEDNNGKSVYRLFEKGQVEYTLQDGEQFIYSNATLSSLYILGTGTVIERAVPENVIDARWTTWDCPALEHELEFLTVGPEYFQEEDHPWFDISVKAKKFNLYATEMLYRKIGSGTKLVIQLPEGGNLKGGSYFISKDGIVDSNGNKDPDFHSQHCSFTIMNESGDPEKLPERGHELIAWSCSSSLNMNMSYDNPQRLYSNQVLSWSPLGENEVCTLKGSDTEEVYLQSERPIKRNGGSDINVEYYDVLQDTRYPLKIYLYKLKDSDMTSSPEDGKDYDIPWTFSSESITVSGDNVSLTNVTLPEGDYVLPIELSKLASGNYVDVFWTELRKLRKYQLTDEEKAIINKISVGTDWLAARKPLDLHDVAEWVYGSASVDVSEQFHTYSIKDAHYCLFAEEPVNDPESGIQNKFVLRSNTDPEFDSQLGKMLLEYGGQDMNSPTSEDFDFSTGDIVCTKTVTKSDESNLDVTCYHVWVYTLQNENEGSFIRTTFGENLSYNEDLRCVRCSVTDLQEEKKSCKYYFVLRPSKITENKSEGKIHDDKCNTVTGITPDSNMTYYFILHSNTDSSYTLKLVYNKLITTDVSPVYEILNPVKYSKPTLTEDADEDLQFFDDVVSEIQKLDKYGKFDFTYDVPDGKLVRYPLDSMAFLDSNHPMNRFTICQYVIPDIKKRRDLVVIGKSR